MKQNINNYILPVAIMAHNEEKVISKAILSCFEQVCPVNYSVKVIVVANGCTDATQEVVLKMIKVYGDRLNLITMVEKGKTIALNMAITYLKKMTIKGGDMPFVVFMDADCVLDGDRVFNSFIKRFEEVPRLSAVGATTVPLIVENNIVSRIYRATSQLSEYLPENGISGGAYCVKYSTISDIVFPETQLADDMFLSMKLDGWIYRDVTISVGYEVPKSLKAEVKKRIRQEIASALYNKHYIGLLESGEQTSLYPTPLNQSYRWTGFSQFQVIIALFKVQGFMTKIMVCISIIMRIYSKLIARYELKKMNNDNKIDYWKIER